ncbi:beta-lactamase domain protein [Flexistipes sinusarabici DSM 4947]|uniref:Beta-lactamase domain protein n=1 Tax=Flexistipes sinusarabici (strain ATCC 49648 / DSM 4947 / MAS 10) TaxID=717231 RepID=F8E431_FLESM|nr:MBL fold metallo-hydrolase [Flexistipes sinusarabici]AEI14384.1 beta-lactamase domain protein [Flexistipes sinusarabici DSM 4947]
MKVTFLTDNYTDSRNLLAEHGFSCLINFEKYNFLFDTGQTISMAHNSDILGKSLDTLDAVFLSHGHYDHTGGLGYISNKKNKTVVYCSSKIADNHRKKNAEDEYKYIGIENQILKEQNLNFYYINDSIHLTPNIIFTHINRYDDFDSDKNLYIKEGEKYTKDPFRDEMFLILQESDGLTIITGCSHRGILNIVRTAINITGANTIKNLIGGFHLFRSSDSEIIEIAEKLNRYNIGHIITGHCTGLNGLFVLKNICRNKITPIKSGLTLTLN